MGVEAVKFPSRYSDRILKMLGRIEHRIAESEVERDAAFKLRYDAYTRDQLIERNLHGRLSDEVYDSSANGWITTTYIDGELASTFRIHVGSDESATLPSLSAFSDEIGPHLRAGRVIVDPTRLAAKLEFSRRYSEMPYIALRPAWLAAEYFDADYVIATMRAEHGAYYRRVFGYTPWSEPREYPNVNCRIVCMGLDFRAVKDRVEAKYPFFRSSEAERARLFGKQGVLASSHRGAKPALVRSSRFASA
jgi:hypothetical protein